MDKNITNNIRMKIKYQKMYNKIIIIWFYIIYKQNNIFIFF